jgi:hypothetical protein
MVSRGLIGKHSMSMLHGGEIIDKSTITRTEVQISNESSLKEEFNKPAPGSPPFYLRKPKKRAKLKISKNKIHILENGNLFYLADDEFEEHESDDMDCFSDLDEDSQVQRKKSGFFFQ